MLKALLTLKTLDSQRFASTVHQPSFRKSLFGGQVLAQGLMAAGLTVHHARTLHSMHAYFLRPGHTNSPVTYAVQVLRDGKSISNRSVLAYQDEALIAQLNTSFHHQEPGYRHEITPTAPPIDPNHLQALRTEQDKINLAQAAGGLAETTPVEFVALSHDVFESQPSDQAQARFWFRSAERLDGTPLQHLCALAFASDIGLLASALLPHDTSLFANEVFPASLDHSLWFHRQPDFNQWHQYVTDSPWAGNARALCHGVIYNEKDQRVATVMQEGLIRPAVKR